MRFSIKTYLTLAKRQLYRLPDDSITKFVVGNESADLDSIASALLYGYIQSSKTHKPGHDDLIVPVANIPAADLPLRHELTALLRHADLKPEQLITLDDIKQAKLSPERTQWTLVDHNVLTGTLAGAFTDRINGVIDHHDDEGKLPTNIDPRIISMSGSCCSLIINHCRPVWDEVQSRASSIGAAIAQDDTRLLDDAAYTSTWTAQAAKLAIGAILIDTINMTDKSKVTDHDKKAMRYLEALVFIAPRLGKDYDRDRFFEELAEVKNNINDLSVRDILRKDYKEWSEAGRKLGTSVVVKSLQFLHGKSKSLSKDLADFAKDQQLAILAVTTAYGDGDDFRRQLALICVGDERCVEITEEFAQDAGKELELEEDEIQLVDLPEIAWHRSWKQRNLAASRKRVAPLLREAMRV